ncbi:MAG TPA: aldehyde dehydrogenase [Spirochaetota bacterium]|nr:aldehyde dehydrogenase [Spirochaetota bacterium]HOD15248.1 aldehyde dehydrogenase [Spirochaetota bacterium]HPG49536.1 aldehyde dehydrogenase [Spirochaetota bacterium]HPN12006.1 aldehyde dehydrogenase [Spirochaetota bacterium]HQL81354.1 aldehyde dehydrogenase [Spirochaetota bacterium]
MKQSVIAGKIQKIRAFYETGDTKEIPFRKRQLRKLKAAIRKNEQLIMDALYKDLKKPAFESYASEIGILYPEITHAIRHVGSWSKRRRVATPLIHFYSRSSVYYEPYGVALIISPWNYPFQLIIAPLVAAIAAGNCAVMKPSELAPATSRVIAKIIRETFPENYIAVIEGGVDATQALLEEKFDYIFFTGGTAVGRIIMRAAAKHLTPLTLELGGKSPVIVDEDADLPVAARRLSWGKFFNAGQTCLAPDYLLVHEKIKDRFIGELVLAIDAFYDGDPAASPDYARIISERHFDRIMGLLKKGKILYGGENNRKKRYIAPTIVGNIAPKDPIMQEEIFGPLLPVMTFRDLGEAIDIVNGRPRPLALYYFSKSKRNQKRVLRETASGGGCINDTVSHVGSQELPFGGIGDSGMGRYHGRSGFETFSHQRGILTRSFWPDVMLRYPPYRKKDRLLKALFRIVG